ncbi:MAG: methyltransferase domain-containing protein [Deltaproteobacteria bacterium]|jgi:SAM-dependent methyltransferase|nr:methyltransferase domain-containing protein [Deltaproteobacteria bacterium]
MAEIAVEQQQEKLKSISDGFYASHLISIGIECGLFETINNKKGATPTEIASELELYEPYIEIWCQTAYYYELLDLENEGRYVLQPHMDELLVDKSSLKTMAAGFRLFVNIAGGRLIDYPKYYKSGGITEEYSAERSKLAADALALGHQIFLFYLSILQDEDRLKKKLIQPFKLMDIGCGSGGFIIKLAQAYQDGLFWGIDPVSFGIEAAKEEVVNLGLDKKVFLEKIGGETSDFIDEFNITSLFLTFHELPPNVRHRVARTGFRRCL